MFLSLFIDCRIQNNNIHVLIHLHSVLKTNLIHVVMTGNRCNDIENNNHKLPLLHQMSLVHSYCLHFHVELLPLKHFCHIFVINKDLWMSKNQTTVVDIFGNGQFLFSFILGGTLKNADIYRNVINFKSSV